ncbi:Protein FIZZY-RELATED 2 [Echinococcus granulosus]|uniref:Fizzy-related protein n=2 Tax=Echinococcus granulosus TaxID=6210 RepID=W6UQP4_ECHGR|nr:Fizzy-related protein [Echinococcus granulosus]EUB55749.1 Fizzy-related protein [Echinococcus granulosus]KAH9281870.1 Protein FIZZY-RELATED 2 [Echinococcus granulosus]
MYRYDCMLSTFSEVFYSFNQLLANQAVSTVAVLLFHRSAPETDMEQGYEKRLLGSPYKSPIKSGSPMKTPTKDNYLDRYIPSRSNAKWKNPSFEVSKCLFQSTSQPSTGVRGQGDASPSSLSNTGANRIANTQTTPLRGNQSNPNLTSTLPRSSSDSIITDYPPHLAIVSTLVHNELVENIDSSNQHSVAGALNEAAIFAPRENLNIFSFKLRKESPCKLKSSPYSLSPVSEKSQRLLQAPQKFTRYIPRMPYKVLDAPDLQDDFYLNLVDWSSQNVLAVGLGASVYLWNAYTSQVTRLCDFSDDTDAISSVSWTKKGTNLAVATYRGRVLIWDVEATRCIRRLEGHVARVGALAWNGDLLASGSRDRQILLRDVRAGPTSGGGLSHSSTTSWSGIEVHSDVPSAATPSATSASTSAASSSSLSLMHIDRELLSNSTRASLGLNIPTSSTSTGSLSGGSMIPNYSGLIPSDLGNTCPGSVRVLKDHKQEVCGLKWSPDNQYLASGGNDNRLLVWSQHVASFSTPILSYEEHVAAVKAISWSPHQHGLLASGGGTADRCIRFWNTLSGQALRSIETESQVCNLAWSEHNNELVSTHGYSQNQILVWQYPSLRQLAKLTGHSSRVLYLAVSPDGENIVTGAGDETLRFWNVFCRAKSPKPTSSTFNLFGAIR